jgi:hypothetical protein
MSYRAIALPWCTGWINADALVESAEVIMTRLPAVTARASVSHSGAISRKDGGKERV